MSFNKKKQKGVSINTPIGRLSFPHIFEPALKYQSKTDFEYSTEILFDEGADLSDFTKACNKALVDYFGEDKKKWPKNIIMPLRDQAEKIEKLEEKGKPIGDLQAGAMWLRAKSRVENPPAVVAKDGKTVLTKQTGELMIYGGVKARLFLMVKVNVVNGTCYVTPYLQGVQTTGQGDAFGGGKTNPTDMFDAVADFDDNEETAADDLY